MALEARLAALTAFVAALLKEHPNRDQLLTRWADFLGPALIDIGPGVGRDEVNIAAQVPAWAENQSNK